MRTVVFGPMRLIVVGIVVSLFVVASMQGVLASGVTQESDSEAVIITVDSTNLRFSPDTVTVTEGDTVRWFWSGQALPHNAVEVNGSLVPRKSHNEYRLAADDRLEIVTLVGGG